MVKKMIGVGILLREIKSGSPAETASQVESLLLHAAYRVVNRDHNHLSGFLGRAQEAFKEAEQDPLHDTCFLDGAFYPVVRDLFLAKGDRQLERCLNDCLRMAARCDIRRQGGGNLDGYNWEFLEEAARAFLDVERFEGLGDPRWDDRVDRWLGTFERFKRQLTTSAA